MNKELINKPIFIISLDTELIWGYVAYPSSEAVTLMKNDDENGRGCIDTLLNLFEKHNIPATWAVVGHLFLDHCECKDGIPHRNMPRFKEDWYSFDPCTDIQKEPLYYGKDIVEKILSNRIEHEIGYHSFSHVVFSECNREVAEAEIKEGIKLAKEFGLTLKSFVFPNNDIGHVDILKENGFRIYRKKNLGRGYPSQNILIRKFNGGIDMIIAPPAEPKWRDGIWEIPTSMLFCGPQSKFGVLSRAKLGLYLAIRLKKVFHIYLHPHDLLRYSSLKDDLDKFLAVVAKKRDEGKIEVMTMGVFAEVLTERGGQMGKKTYPSFESQKRFYGKYRNEHFTQNKNRKRMFGSLLPRLESLLYHQVEGGSMLKECIKELVISRIKKIETTKSKQHTLKIIDMGCGSGWVTKILSEYGDVVGIDLYAEAARKLYPDLKIKQVNIITEEIEGKYDIVVSTEVLEHLISENQQIYVKKAFDILKEGGYLILTTPNKRSDADEKLRKRYFKSDQQPIENWIDKKSLISLLEQHGFKIRFVGSCLFLPVFIRNWNLLYGVYITFCIILYPLYKFIFKSFKSSNKGLTLMVIAQKTSEISK